MLLDEKITCCERQLVLRHRTGVREAVLRMQVAGDCALVALEVFSARGVVRRAMEGLSQHRPQPAPAPSQGPSEDLMDALRASVAEAGERVKALA